MLFARVFLLVQALLLSGFGIAYFLYPQEMANLSGMILMQTSAIVDVRAYYGALQLGLGIFLLSAAMRPGYVPPALSLLTLLFAALALGRIAGLYLDGAVGQRFNFIALGYEGASSLVAYIGFRLVTRMAGHAPKVDSLRQSSL